MGQLGTEFLTFELNDRRIARGNQQRRGSFESFAVFRSFDQAVVGFENCLAVQPMIIDLPTVTLGIDSYGLP